MLVLAGVAINLAVDSNGLFAKANKAAVAQDRGVILEKLNLELLWSNTAEEKVEFLQLLENNSWADSDAVLNIQNLIGKKLTTGNGSEYKDVYTVEIEDNTYKLMYYDNEQTRIEVGIIGSQGTVPTYTQADIDELLRYFNFDETTGVLTANVDVVGSNYHAQTLPAKLVIPYEINGVKVTNIVYSTEAFKGIIESQDLEELIILTDIGGQFNAGNLKKITLGDEVTSIGVAEFSGCTSLSNIVIPNSVTSIGYSAFYNCTSLSNIVIPSSVTSIGDSAFYNCTSLSNIVIPNSVTSIESDTFSGCTSLSNIVIPNSVTSIGDSAFSGCTSLSNIVIPNSVTSIGNSAFSGCTNLTQIEVDENNEDYKSIEGMLYNKDGTELIRGVNKQNITVAEGTTSIRSSAFSYCTSLSNIVIPSSVTNIGSSAFSHCTNLKQIEVNENNASYKSIDGMLYNKDGTELIIGVNKQNITVAEGTTSIGNGAFSYCTSLSNIVIPSSVASIGDWAFEYCTSLNEITIPSSVTSIGQLTFFYCTSLSNVTIPRSVTSIGSKAFGSCKLLNEIIIPSSVTKMGFGVFYDCSSLTTIYCEVAKVPSGWMGWINGCTADVVWSYTQE